jgi:hypothetical protein
MDIEFEKLKPMLPEIVLNTTAAHEHEGMVERKIRVLKERHVGLLIPYHTRSCQK